MSNVSRLNSGVPTSDIDSTSQSSSKLSALARGNACATCRGRKVRCDAVQPICTPCMQSRRDCAYVPKKKLPGPASAATLGLKLAELEVKYHELSLSSGLGLASQRGLTIPGGPSGTSNHHSIYEDISEGDRDAIIDMFFHRQYHYGFFLPRERFRDALTRPNPTQRPHPALVLAMVLIGRSTAAYSPEKHTANPTLTQLLGRIPSTDLLVARIQSSLNESLANVDRLQDYFSASGILVHWFFSQGRLQEAQFLSASTARLIIGAKLHQINGEMLEGISNDVLRGDATLPWDYTLMGRPSSIVEIGRRILTFWQAFFHDKLLGLVTGLPSAFEDSEEARVSTVWPGHFADYESGSAFRDDDFDSIDQLLFAHESGRSLEHGHRLRDTVYAMGCQGITFLDRTARLAVYSQADPALTQPDSIYNYIRKLQVAIDNFSSRIPKSPRELHFRKTIAQAEERVSENEYYQGYIQAIVYVAKIQLYRSLEIRQSFLPRTRAPSPSQDQQPYHTLRVEAAAQATEAIRRVCTKGKLLPEDGSKNFEVPVANPSNITLGFLLASAAVTLAEEIKRLQINLSMRDEASNQANLRVQLEAVEKNFQASRTLLAQLSTVFPVLAIQVTRLDGMRQGAISHK